MRIVPPVTFALLVFVTLTAIATAAPIPRRDDADAYDIFHTDYHWLEIEDIGQSVVQLNDNDYTGPLDIGFCFPFYGQLYQQFYIGSNGLIGFGPPDNLATAANQQLPDQNTPNNIIALYWKDLAENTFWGDGNLFYGIRDGKFVVEYQNYPEINQQGHSPANTITMEIVLDPNGDITLQYATIGDAFNLATGTIGIEGPGGNEGVTIRHNGDGEAVAAGTAFLLSEHGPGNFLIWDGGLTTTSGDAEETVLRALGHSVGHLRLRTNQALPQDLGAYEGVFVNLGNFGPNGQNYHQLTDAEGRILAAYLDEGGALYLEGGDFWFRDPVTPVHHYFPIEGLSDGNVVTPPIVGLAGGLAGGLTFADYQDNDNRYPDHLSPTGDAIPVISFHDQQDTAIGMISYHSRTLRVIGSSIEFGALVDGGGGTKRELVRRMVEFFRSPPPQFAPPVHLRATAGNSQVTLTWDSPAGERARREARLDLQHRIAALIPRDGHKPSVELRAEISHLRHELADLQEPAIPQRDDLHGFNIYVDGAFYDFTNAHTYTVIELQNGQAYNFTVTAVS